LAAVVLFGSTFAKAEEAGQGFSLEPKVTFHSLRERAPTVIDGGSISKILNISVFMTKPEIFYSLWGSAAQWRDESGSSKLKWDQLGGQIGLRRAREVGDAGLDFRFFLGGYYPLEWNSSYSDLYQIPRIQGGTSASFVQGSFGVLGEFSYFWPASPTTDLEVDTVKLKLEPGSFYNFSFSASCTLSFLEISAKLGQFGFDGAKLSGPMGLNRDFEVKSIPFLAYTLGAHLPEDLLTIEITYTKALSDFDKLSVEYATGLRAMPELSNAFGIGIKGKL
jgi:hypothetical protein